MLTSGQDRPESILRIKGKATLGGHVPISGAKNSTLAIMAGAVLCSGSCHIRNVPAIADVQTMIDILKAVGLKVTSDEGVLDIDAKHISQSHVPYDLVNQMRAGFFVIGPLLARLGVAYVPLPGGCAIGTRPVDLHVKGLQALGADVIIDQGIIQAHARHSRLQGAKIYLDYPSVGATETLMMAATLAEGETIIENCAQEPEVIDLANFCLTMGAKIYGAGTKTIVIEGVPQLHSADFGIIPDRIEAATFMVAAAITRSTISMSPVIPDHLTAAIAKLEEIGAKVILESPNSIRVEGSPRYRHTHIETLPYPGFPTDMQAQFMALLTLSDGDSVITETVFENRLRHVAELNRMGADIRVKGQNAIVRGVSMLSGAPVVATELRASAALVLAALAADGVTTIQGLHHLDRGYDNLEVKLQKLGAKLQRIQNEPDANHLPVAPAPAPAPVAP